MAECVDVEVSRELQLANKRIADLKEDIRQLSAELRKKDKLLSSYIEVAVGQSSRLASLGALQDTVPWDSSTCPHPSCSTPIERRWTEVVTGGRRRDSKGAPRLSLSNRYGALSADENPALPGDIAPAAAAPPPRQATDQTPLATVIAPSYTPSSSPPMPLTTDTAPSSSTLPSPPPLAPSQQASDPTPLSSDTAPASPPLAKGAQAPNPDLQRPPVRSDNSTARREMVREAVRRRSGHPQPKVSSPGSSQPPAAQTGSNDRPPPNNGSPQPQPSSPSPLFPLTTLIVGDSITRNIRFITATTHCFPGATVPVILSKLPDLLPTLPSSITRIIVHIGSNDTSKQQSELTKKDFKNLFSFLAATGKSIFISGPIPIHTSGRFSRLLSLNTWLQPICRALNFGFIDNFNLFWNRPSFFKADGVHPNILGSRMLTANIHHTILNQ